MSWYNVDDRAHAHPKLRRAGLAAAGLWALAGSHAKAYHLDGQVPRYWVDQWGPDAGKQARRLVDIGLWHSPGHTCPRCPQPDEGWVFHDWDDYQLGTQIEQTRADNARRQRESRARKASNVTPASRDMSRDRHVTAL